MIRVLFVTQGDEKLASSRFRAYDLVKFFPQDIRCQFLSLPKGGQISRAYFALQVLFHATRHDVVFLQKVLFPGFFVSLLRGLKAKLIYDYDDALFARPPADIYGEDVFLQKKASLEATLRKVDHVVCGNHYLADYTRDYSPSVSIIPTALNVNQYRPPAVPAADGAVVIGWIGKSENLEYLKSLAPVFTRLGRRFANRVRLQVICDAPLSDVADMCVINIPWELGKESSQISKFDIGIMPLADSAWARGKCAFKLIQYMACGVASVSSPVGMNSDVVAHGQNGLLARSTEDWYDCLENLVNDAELRLNLGMAGRKSVEGEYDVVMAAEKLCHVIRRLLDKVE